MHRLTDKFKPQKRYEYEEKSDSNADAAHSDSRQADNDTTGIVAYSDTTSTDTASAQYNLPAAPDWDDFDDDDIFNALKNIGNLGVWATVFTVLPMFFVLLICLAPLIAIILIVWLIARNRNQRLKLAEKAMENGQPIPQEALSVPTSTDEDIKNKGLRNIFLGLGLVACGYFIIGDLLQGIGVILFFYGLGQAFIARSSSKKKEQEEVLNNEIDHVENGHK